MESYHVNEIIALLSGEFIHPSFKTIFRQAAKHHLRCRIGGLDALVNILETQNIFPQINCILRRIAVHMRINAPKARIIRFILHFPVVNNRFIFRSPSGYSVSSGLTVGVGAQAFVGRAPNRCHRI